MLSSPRGNDDVTLGRCVHLPMEVFMLPRGDVFVSLGKLWCLPKEMMVLLQGDVFVSSRKWWCLPNETWLPSWGNDGVSPGRCDHLPKEDEDVHAIPREMYSKSSFLGACSFLRYFPGTSINGFLSFFATLIWKCVVSLQSGFATTGFGEEVVVVYQMQDTWCTFMGFQEEMDRCITYFKKIGLVVPWIRHSLFYLLTFHCPKSRVRGMAFHSMQREEND